MARLRMERCFLFRYCGNPGRLAPSHGVDADRGLVLDRGNPPGAAGDTSFDAAASPLRPERAPAGGVLHTRHRLSLPSSPASIIAQRVGAILPSSRP